MTYSEQLKAVVTKLDSDGADSEEEWAANILRALGITPPSPDNPLPKGNNYVDGETVVINGIAYEYDDYYKRLDVKEGTEARRTEKVQILCPHCFNSQFTISYGSYECIANCSCGHSMTVYDG